MIGRTIYGVVVVVIFLHSYGVVVIDGLLYSRFYGTETRKEGM